MDIRGKVTHARLDPAIQRATIGQMTTQTHARGTNLSIASGQRKQIIHAETSVFIISGKFLIDSQRRNLTPLPPKREPNEEQG